MVRASDLAFSYAPHGFRLQVQKFHVDAGERVAIVGPSGSGKTTLLHLIAGILSPDTGQILVAQAPVTELSDDARRDFRIRQIGLVFQEFELIEYLPVLDNILLPYRINRSMRLTAEVRQRAQELAEALQVGDKLRRFPHQLSQGEKQRIAICRALISRPKLLLADEPTGNLDPANKEKVVDLLTEFAEENGVALVMVTHDRALLDRFQRVVDFQDLSPIKTNSPIKTK